MSSNVNMTNQEYSDYVDTKAKKSPILKNIILAFIVGGLICIIGQIITDICMNCGIDKKSATTITTIILIFIGAFLTAIRVYPKLGKHAGAGSIIPITGFSNSIVAPAIEFKLDDYILSGDTNSIDDLHEINGADKRKVEDMAELIELIKSPRFSTNWQIWIIDECHRLSKEAQSLLLKLVEEPPVKTLFIFCTTDPGDMLDTLRSRMNVTYNVTLSRKDIMNALTLIAKKSEVKYLPQNWEPEYPLTHYNMSYDNPQWITLRVLNEKDEEGNPIKPNYTFIHDAFGEDYLFQRVDKEDSNYDIVMIKCSPFGMFNFAMQYSDRVEVLEPKALRDKIGERVAELYDKYDVRNMKDSDKGRSL